MSRTLFEAARAKLNAATVGPLGCSRAPVSLAICYAGPGAASNTQGTKRRQAARAMPRIWNVKPCVNDGGGPVAAG